MSLKLNDRQKAAIADCGCPLAAGIRRKPLAKKAIIIPLVAFALALWLAWALWAPALWWLLGIYGVLVVGVFAYRLVRGHTLGCAIRWSPVAALYIIGDGIVTGLSAP
ncbi:MAG: hypothetical protein ACREGD_01965 [Candidatus Saccharimonadales bacterium]